MLAGEDSAGGQGQRVFAFRTRCRNPSGQELHLTAWLGVQVRLRAKGGHGGHNGMKSISAHLQVGSKQQQLARFLEGPTQPNINMAALVRGHERCP